MNDPYKHPKWQKKRLQVLERDGWKCVACDDSESTLHVHHFYYDGNPWDVDNKFLQTLCDSCHASLGHHPKGGVWWSRGIEKSCVFVHFCPSCGRQEFENSGNCIKCLRCGWDTQQYGPCAISDAVRASIEKNGSQKADGRSAKGSVRWLTSVIEKARKNGASDIDLFTALFPDQACANLYRQVEAQSNALCELLRDGDIRDDQLEDVFRVLVCSRRALHGRIREIAQSAST